MLAAAQKDRAEGVNVLSLETGHVPMLSAPEAAADILIGVAKDVEGIICVFCSSKPFVASNYIVRCLERWGRMEMA
jgi:hypothetical protein